MNVHNTSTNVHLPLLRDYRVPPVTPTRPQKIPVHRRDYFQFYTFRTNGLAFAYVGAAPEHLMIRLRHHPERSFLPFGLALRQHPQMMNLRTRE